LQTKSPALRPGFFVLCGRGRDYRATRSWPSAVPAEVKLNRRKSNPIGSGGAANQAPEPAVIGNAGQNGRSHFFVKSVGID
jgi:hypothetical protein